jgi:hypothetical protein
MGTPRPGWPAGARASRHDFEGGREGTLRDDDGIGDDDCGYPDERARSYPMRRPYWFLGLERWSTGFQVGLGLVTVHCLDSTNWWRRRSWATWLNVD